MRKIANCKSFSRKLGEACVIDLKINDTLAMFTFLSSTACLKFTVKIIFINLKFCFIERFN